MRKEGFVLFLLMLMVFAFPVYGAGTSTGNTDRVVTKATPTPLNNDTDNSEDDGNTVVVDVPENVVEGDGDITVEVKRRFNLDRRRVIREEYGGRSCEDVETRGGRIKCRLAQGERYSETGSSIVPEACRLDGEKKGKCVELYSSLKNCYEQEGTSKDRCFKRAIGLKKAKLANEDPAERPAKAKDYVIALLYDLQEKIEDKSEAGDVDPDDAASLIDRIVEIKQDILNGEGRIAVKSKMMVFKTQWKGVMGGGRK